MKSLKISLPVILVFLLLCCNKIKAKAIFTESAAIEGAGGEKAIKTCGAKRNESGVRRNTAAMSMV